MIDRDHYRQAALLIGEGQPERALDGAFPSRAARRGWRLARCFRISGLSPADIATREIRLEVDRWW
jgi:hypothetical protein